jgi:hypothetical protein
VLQQIVHILPSHKIETSLIIDPRDQGTWPHGRKNLGRVSNCAAFSRSLSVEHIVLHPSRDIFPSEKRDDNLTPCKLLLPVSKHVDRMNSFFNKENFIDSEVLKSELMDIRWNSQ